MKISVITTFAVLVLCSTIGQVLGQGSLTPSTGPTNTMKTLAQLEPRIDIATLSGDSSFQYLITQPGSYYLSGNITPGAGKSAIGLSTNDVTIDLMGFTIFGNGGYYGICALQTANRTQVSNGHLINWPYGVNTYTIAISTNVVLKDLVIIGTNQAFGGGITVGEGAQILRCQIANYSANSANALSAGDNALVDHCKFEKVFAGISLGVHSIISDCMVRDVSTGGSAISAGSYAIVRNNEVYSGGQVGIRVSDDCLVENNNCNNCTGSGIYTSGGNNRVEGNQTHYNLYGIQGNAGTTNMVVRNFAHGNTNGNFSLGPVLAGPTFIGVTTLTNHPWANFSY